MGVRNWRGKASIAASLGAATLTIRALGLRRAARIAWWAADRFPARPLAVAPEQLAERQAEVIAAVADRLPFKPRCLPRALVLASQLRRRRLAGDLCLGTRIAGAFDAHAWIEIEGRPIRESNDLNVLYRCLWRLPTAAP